MTEKQFIKKYSEEILLGKAAVFAGAGLSIPAGFVNWKQLLQPLAEEIGLNMEKETDYLAVAQFYYNKKRNRSSINSTISRAFNAEAKDNPSIDILTRLPIKSYWTTNYDHLIEKGLEKNNRKPDIKITKENLSQNIVTADATVYKMHGDIQFPDDVVLIKDDYETYGIKREAFTTLLKGHLLSKTFLFIGFSFEDPNLNSILSWIKALLGDNLNEHYCLFEQIKQKSDEDDNDYLYKKVKQELLIDDLQRYGIESILLESYSEIPRILRQIEIECNLRNVFISSSISVNTEFWSKSQAEDFVEKIAENLVKNNIAITSGYGIGIGSSVITGVLKEVKKQKYAHFDEFLKLYPFPQLKDGEDYTELWHSYRQEMMSHCGVAIFAFGNKLNSQGECVIANGMIDEYEVAKEKQMLLIPIAATGEAAEWIYNDMYKSCDTYSYLNNYWQVLKEEKSPEQLANIIVNIIMNTSR